MIKVTESLSMITLIIELIHMAAFLVSWEREKVLSDVNICNIAMLTAIDMFLAYKKPPDKLSHTPGAQLRLIAYPDMFNVV